MLLTNVWKQFLSISAKLLLFQNEYIESSVRYALVNKDEFRSNFFDRSKGMNKILNRQAFFADGTPFYRLYTSDGTGYGVRLRFRTAKDNAELVTVVTDSVKADMHKCFTEGRFDYY